MDRISKKKRKTTFFRQAVQNARKAALKQKNISASNDVNKIIYAALKAARRTVKKNNSNESNPPPRIIPIPTKSGGFLPLLIPILSGVSALGGIAGGATGIAKAVNEAAAAKKQLTEAERHNKSMEAIALGRRGSSLYLGKYRKEYGLYLKPYPKKKLTFRALTDKDLNKYGNILPYFRGVFMRNGLPKSGPLINESVIVNLDSKKSTGTHWVCYKKRGNHVAYFDSNGNFKPFYELLKYLGPNIKIRYNYKRYQKLNSFNCGHLCLQFLLSNKNIENSCLIMSLTLTSNKSILSADFSPPLDLSTGNWVIGLIDFQSYSSIPIIMKDKNKIYYYEGKTLKTIIIPPSAYEIDDLNDYIQSVVGDPTFHGHYRTNNPILNFCFHLQANVNTLKSEIFCSKRLDFTKDDCIGSVLGFKKQILETGKLHESDVPVNILKVTSIQIECNISSGSYRNSSVVHILHEFFPTSPPGYKIIEVPSNVIYLSVSIALVDNITLRIVDQGRDIVDFNGETTTVRLHLKQLNGD